MRKMSFLIFTAMLFVQPLMARDWDKVKIPGARCGDGREYFVFVDKKTASKNLLVEFMGGGACWSKETCYGKDLKTWAHPIPELPAFSYMTNDWWGWAKHPFVDDSAVFFPYCTGDVYAAKHIARYDNKVVFHQGYTNVVLAFKYLAEEKIIDFQSLKRIAVWGASAGAIGSMVHLKTIEPYVAPNTKKYAIIDSAGLHFGRDFWKKFTPELAHDYQQTFFGLGLDFTLDDGFMAPALPGFLERTMNWNIGFLQSKEDKIMSEVFGDISREEHRRLVESAQGLPSISAPYKNVSVWINESAMHTFLLTKATSGIENQQSISAMKFVSNLLRN